jgi:two-component system, chemotaxis family, sensor kinase CheA
VQYRNRILPLVSLRKVLGSYAPDPDQRPDPVQVVVFNDGDRSVGMVVDEILDVTEEAVTVRQGSERKGLLGSAVVGKQVTDFLDLHEVIRAAGASWFQGTDGPLSGQRILVADASAFSRGMVRSGLEMAGYVVLEAASLDEVLSKLERRPVSVVLAALELPPGGCSALLVAMQQHPEWQKIPVVALADSAEQVQAAATRTAGFEACVSKFERVLVLEALAKVLSRPAWFALATAGVEGER